jgi:hypothetical protein
MNFSICLTRGEALYYKSFLSSAEGGLYFENDKDASPFRIFSTAGWAGRPHNSLPFRG